MLELDSSRASVEPPLDGDYVRQVKHQVALNYQLSEALLLNTHYQYQDDRYVGIERNENITSYGAEVAYDFRSNVVVALIAQREEKDSSLEGFSYEQNLVGLQVILGVK